VEQYALKNKVPLVLTAHNIWTDKLFLDLTCKISWDKIIAISHYIKRELSAVGVPNEKMAVVHHGTDEKIFFPGKPSSFLFKKYPELKGKKRVVFSPARIGLAKGCDITIEAFRLVKNKFPDSMMVMSGSGNIIDWGLSQNKEIAFFISLIKHLHLEDSVYINTFSIDKEMPELYRLADLVVYPSSVQEPFGLAMLEAMATAKPIIVTEAGAMPEIIKNDVNGYVVPMRNHEALAEKIIGLLSDDELRVQLGRTGREQVETIYNMKVYAKKVFKIYEDVIEGYSKKRKEKAAVQKKFIMEGKEIGA
jgi:glycosyltransferase involved in cell wall biosynthesis